MSKELYPEIETQSHLRGKWHQSANPSIPY